MQSAQHIFRGRLLKGAVPEAANYPRDLCNQQCKVHIYLKDGIPYDQLTGKKHDCYHARIAKMFIGHYGMIRIDRLEQASISTWVEIVANAKEFCRKWSLAFDDWKKTGKVPTSEEVEGYY